jgi:hypothetical protein
MPEPAENTRRPACASTESRGRFPGRRDFAAYASRQVQPVRGELQALGRPLPSQGGGLRCRRHVSTLQKRDPRRRRVTARGRRERRRADRADARATRAAARVRGGHAATEDSGTCRHEDTRARHGQGRAELVEQNPRADLETITAQDTGGASASRGGHRERHRRGSGQGCGPQKTRGEDGYVPRFATSTAGRQAHAEARRSLTGPARHHDRAEAESRAITAVSGRRVTKPPCDLVAEPASGRVAASCAGTTQSSSRSGKGQRSRGGGVGSFGSASPARSGVCRRGFGNGGGVSGLLARGLRADLGA